MIIDIVRKRYEKAKEHLASAKLLLENDKNADSISRSYYAILTAARALKVCGQIFARGEIKRWHSDYGDFVVVTKDEAEDFFQDAFFVKLRN